MNLLAVLLGTLAVAATAPPQWATFHADAASIRYPPGWHATTRRLTLVSSPDEPFAVASFPFPAQPRPDGCEPAGTLAKLPAGGAAIFAIDYGSNLELRGFPQRPSRISLGSRVRQECYGPSYVVKFNEANRFFEFDVVFGPHASSTIRSTVLRTLNSFVAKPA